MNLDVSGVVAALVAVRDLAVLAVFLLVLVI